MPNRKQTALVHAPRQSAGDFRSLVTPVHRGSTIVYPDYRSFMNRRDLPRSAYTYGLYGTPTTRTLAAALTQINGADETFLVPSGLLAVTTTILALVNTGETILLPDTVYPPVRKFARTTLARLGIGTVFYDPKDLASVKWNEQGMRLLWLESPGSTTMEVQDTAAFARAAHEQGMWVGCDNSWASPLFCNPFEQGVDIVAEAVTKHLAGHSDLVMGSIAVRGEAAAAKIDSAIRSLGIGVSPDDCSLVLRGLESAYVRLRHIEASALQIARHLEGNDCVTDVLHPGLPTSTEHDLWQQFFTGSCGLFTVAIKDEPEDAFEARFSRLKLLQIGASWGGSQSLVAPTILADERTVTSRFRGRQLIRLSIGTEAVDDLLDDVDRLFSKDG